MSEPAPLDPRRFRDTIGLFATGVAVIAARAADEVLAMTVNAVSSVSLEPMLVLFCPGKKSRFARHVDNLSGFSINLLRHDQQALSSYFAGGWKEQAPPPFRLVPGAHAPRLEGCLASIDCTLQQLIDAGDHWIVIGRVRDLHLGIAPHQPLLFFGGRYRAVDVADSRPAPDLTNSQAEPAHIFYHD
ncbi:MAG: flavin reductase family protein [Proteobacteria bacterium]|nr:flavin reductase family protein [Pseudomonadota bacterium]